MDITANSLHPGAIVTNIFRQSNIVHSTLINLIINVFLALYSVAVIFIEF